MRLYEMEFSDGNKYHCIATDIENALEMAKEYHKNIYFYGGYTKSVVEISDNVNIQSIFENQEVERIKKHIKRMAKDEYEIIKSNDLDTLHYTLASLIDGRTPEEIYHLITGGEWEDGNSKS